MDPIVNVPNCLLRHLHEHVSHAKCNISFPSRNLFPSFSFFLNSWTKVCNNGEKSWPRRAGSLFVIRGRKLTMHRYAINFYKIRKMKMKKPFLPHPPKCIFHLFIKFQPDHVLTWETPLFPRKRGKKRQILRLASINFHRFDPSGFP